MMREIKFRAWDKENKQMKYLEQEGNDYHVYQNWFANSDIKQTPVGNSSDVSVYILMQFTGLHDKNGKEIYEGDVVKYKKYNYEVVYNDYYGCYGLKDQAPSLPRQIILGHGGSSTGYSPYLWNWLSKQCEVIGNIYENPELTGGKQ